MFIVAIKLLVRLNFSHGVLVWLVKPILHSPAVATYRYRYFLFILLILYILTVNDTFLILLYLNY